MNGASNFQQDYVGALCNDFMGSPFTASEPGLFVDQSVRNVKYRLQSNLVEFLWNWNDGFAISQTEYESE